MKFQLGTDDNNRTTRVIDALSEQILTEASAFAFEHVAERFERSVARTSNCATVPAVVEQGVNGFLQHSLFVANNDVRRFEQKQIFKPVIAIDNPAIKIVQVGSRKTPAFQRNKWTQIGGNDGQHIENHPIR